jgi:hypothetical protein
MQVTFGLYANAARRCDAVQEEEKRRAECTNKMLLCCGRRMGKVELWGCIGNRPSRSISAAEVLANARTDRRGVSELHITCLLDLIPLLTYK